MTDKVVSVERVPAGGMSLELPRLFAMAIERGAEGVAVLKELVALKEQMEAHEARREFAAAMAAFKAECPPVERRSKNEQFSVTREGVKSPRLYADLEDIAATVQPVLGKHGLSFRWTGLTSVDGKMSLDCVVTHVAGHSESSSATGSERSNAGASDLQKTGAAMTYLQRYSLIMALGLTTCEPDQDGNDEQNAGPCVTREQVEVLEELIGQRPEGSRARLLAYLGVKTMEEVPASKFEWLVNDIGAKIKAGLR